MELVLQIAFGVILAPLIFYFALAVLAVLYAAIKVMFFGG